MNLKSIAIALSIALLFPTSASADSDPFPGVENGQPVPGYSMNITCSDTPEIPDNCIRRSNGHLFICPSGSANDLTATLRADGSWASVVLWCRKSWVRQSTPEEDADFNRRVREATAAAEAESRAWNEANPGKQKCISWGPIIHANGVSQASGGVCANPVSSPTAPSGSSPVSAGSVSESDIVGSSSSSSISPSTSASISPDPIPGQTSAYRGNGYPYTVVVEGPVGITGCPAGFQAANGLIVVAGTGRTYTECWPERAWTANRLGGEAWELYKATGGSYDPSVEIDRRAKVDLLKSKAKELASAAALQTPGIERCSSWNGFGESGTECAYAFIRPSASSSSVSTSNSATASAGLTTSSTVSASVTESAPAAATPGSTESSTASSISVALSSVAFKASAGVIARTAAVLTPSQLEAQKISGLALKIAGLKSTTKDKLVTLPKAKDLNYKVKSLTPKTCTASSLRLNFKTKGVCEVRVQITDNSGNAYEFTKRIRRN